MIHAIHLFSPILSLYLSSSPSRPRTHPFALKNDLDEIFTDDCIACGDILIRTIDEPFVPASQMDAYMRSWRAHGTAPAAI